MSVKVGVRVRPFNKRQQQLGCQRCIQMNGNTTYLYDNQKNQKKFVYDYSFWSHDKYTIDPDGINVPVDQKYADQRRVFQAIGSEILTNAWDGYNCCLFAYGQTGSGKSYSMIGYGANKGIIPIVCDQIFTKIKATQQKNLSFQVTVSMMEIYNQTIRDLLVKKQNPNLKICQHKTLGVYVQGLHKCSVKSYEQIQKKIEQGSHNRSIAATLMNQSSSRSHTIVSINFVQKLQVTKSQMSLKYSVIHLVDLAGSQSVGKTGVSSKDRLRQTAKINQSLSTLGRVIQILADNAGKVDKNHVPYRDSKLTFILRNALGGNSRTAMICAISPADDNYQQTLSTLRYASRAKKIQNKAIINQSDVDKLIRHLRQQNQMLKKMLKDIKWNKTYLTQQNIINIQNMMQQLGIQADAQQLLLENQNENSLIQQDIIYDNKINQQASSNDSIALDYSIQKQLEIDQKQPYITNISQDQLLSYRVKYSCKNLIVGNKSGSPKPDIVLAALGILPHHCKIWTQKQQEGQGQTVFIQPMEEGASDYIFLNGGNVNKRQKLYNLDRIIFGTGCLFLVKIYEGKPRTQIDLKNIDYSFAISQMNIPGNSRSVIQEGQIRKQILQQIQAQYQKTKKENEQKLKRQMQQQQKIYQQQLLKIQQAKKQQAQNLKQQLLKKQEEAKLLEDQKRKIVQEIQKFKLLQTQLKKQKQEKQAYQQTVHNLQQKMKKVQQLQSQLKQVHEKQIQMKQQIEKQQQRVRKQLQIKTIVCTNQNILNQYKLQMAKKAKNAKQLRDLFVKKQKIQLQKQLVALVPMVQRFNLIAKQMKKKVYCGLSVQYKYISQSQIAQVLKTSTYKGKFKIIIHVINKDQKRGYYWDVQTFKNRFQLALEYFESYIMDSNDQKLNDFNIDPYWDPDQYIHLGSGFLSLQSLLYGFSYEGKINFIKTGGILGTVEAKIYPCDQNGVDKSFEFQQKFELQNPRDLLQKNLYFGLQLKNVQLNKTYRKLCIEYEIVQDNYKTMKYTTDEFIEDELKYQKVHTLKELSQNAILNMTQKPLVLKLKGLQKPLQIRQQDCLTQRSNVSSFAGQSPNQKQFDDNASSPSSKKISEFSVQAPKLNTIKIGNDKQKQKGFVFQNLQVMAKIDRQYNLKKSSLIQKKKQKQKQWASKQKIQNNKKGSSKNSNKEKQCQIY